MGERKNLSAMFLVIMALLVIPGMGCSSNSGQTLIPPSAPSPPVEAKLAFSHAPKVGETAEVTMTIYTHSLPDSKLGNIRAWLEFSYIDTFGNYESSKKQVDIAPQKVLSSGDLSWEGELSLDNSLEFRTDVKIPKAGIWEVTGYFEGDVGLIHSKRIKLAVEQDRAGIYGSEAYKSGELEWMEDYSPNIAVPLDRPITWTFDLSKPPLLGEPVELTWSIVSEKDIETANVWVYFEKMKPGSAQSSIPKTNSILVNGSLSWQGSLKQYIPQYGSATIKFPEEGDWYIQLNYKDSVQSFGCSHIVLNVNADQSRWGWAEPHKEKPIIKFPPPPPPPPATR